MLNLAKTRRFGSGLLLLLALFVSACQGTTYVQETSSAGMGPIDVGTADPFSTPPDTEIFWIYQVDADFDDVLDNVLGVLAEYNFPGTVAKDFHRAFLDRITQTNSAHVLNFDHYVVVEFCNMETGMRALAADLRFGLFMPCKLVIYQEAHQPEVTLMAYNPAFIQRVVPGPVTDEVAATIMELVQAMFDNADF